MEAITRLVTDSFARHGFDRPVDSRRLQWSRWFRCDSPHSLLVVPSKPGIFALAEEVMDLGATTANVATDALVRPPESSSAAGSISSTTERISDDASPRRMLAVLQFFEDDDMAFTLDRMFTRINPMRDPLASGKCFLRFVVIQDQAQRRSICAALNQWTLNSSEKATGIPAGFSTSLEVANVARTPSASAESATDRVAADALVRPPDSSNCAGRTLLSDSDTLSKSAPAPLPKLDSQPAAPYLASGAARNLHCPHPLPSGF